MKGSPRFQQTGAALLLAMLTVTLVASFAAAAAWQQWRAVQVETAERQRVQSGWLLIGALGWAQLILREDKRTTQVDSLNEPWAVPLQESRLSSFLASDKNNSVLSSEDENAEVYLSGQITDAQSFININNLIENNTIHKPTFDALEKLFDLLNLEPAELTSFANNMRFAADTNPANLTANQAFAPLLPQRTEQLGWLGLSSATLERLSPYIRILPTRNTKLNVNTASAELIYALVPSMKIAEAKALVERRQSTPFRNLGEVIAVLGNPAVPYDLSALSTETEFFEVRGRLRLNELVVQERSLVQRNGVSTPITIWRERTALPLKLGPNAKKLGPEGSLQ